MRRFFYIFFIEFLLTMSMLVRSSIDTPAFALTHAPWAWPGMQFVVYNRAWYSCSVGFPAWDSAGNHYFITAGHCFRSHDGLVHYVEDVKKNIGEDIYSADDVHHPVGYERLYVKPQGKSLLDISLVEMYPGKSLHGSGWQHIPNRPVRSRVGAGACLAGQRHRRITCGVITGVNLNNYARGYYYSDQGINEANYCGLPGDSGGAVFNDSGALGINISGNGHCSNEYYPIDQVLKALRTKIPSLTIFP